VHVHCEYDVLLFLEYTQSALLFLIIVYIPGTEHQPRDRVAAADCAGSQSQARVCACTHEYSMQIKENEKADKESRGVIEASEARLEILQV
jgi:hypothetical protein